MRRMSGILHPTVEIWSTSDGWNWCVKELELNSKITTPPTPVLLKIRHLKEEKYLKMTHVANHQGNTDWTVCRYPSTAFRSGRSQPRSVWRKAAHLLGCWWYSLVHALQEIVAEKLKKAKCGGSYIWSQHLRGKGRCICMRSRSARARSEILSQTNYRKGKRPYEPEISHI